MKLSVVTPTFNESGNIRQFLMEMQQQLDSYDYEIIVVDDDSPDLTWKVAEEAAAGDRRIRVLRRTAQRGLGNSVIDGFKSSGGDAVACIDADLQHDPAVIPEMLAALERGGDIVVASRYIAGGGTGKWGWTRLAASKFATWLAVLMLGVSIKDPMSGYFMLRREDFQRVCGRLNGDGFKIMLELLVNLKPKKVVEVGYTFRSRLAGESKLSGGVILSYLQQLWRLSAVAGRLPDRLLKFATVGFTGVIVNLTVMALLLHFAGWKDWRASAVSTLVAIINNYVLNNAWTCGDHRIRGARIFAGYLSYLVMSLGGLAVTTSSYVAITHGFASVAGQAGSSLSKSTLMLAQFVSITLGIFMNYTLNKRFTWGLRHAEELEPAKELSSLEAKQQRAA